MLKKICLINVGANASHGSLRSPLFTDGSFEFIPIPDPFLKHNDNAVRYCQLKAHNGIKITELVREKYYNECAHYDPEFETYTYGDYPNFSPRAANLSKLSKGDLIFFFARLVLWKNGKFTKDANFYLIGFIEIENIYRNITKRPSERILEKIKNNAHIIRGECNPIFYDDFWVFQGSNRSKRFRYAIPFDREFIEESGILDAKFRKWNWNKFRTELSAIGSYLRSAKLIQERNLVESFLKKIKESKEGHNFLLKSDIIIGEYYI